MRKDTREVVEFVINDAKRAIKNNAPKIALKENPNLLTINQKEDKAEIHQTLKKLLSQYNELLPLVKSIKNHIQDITETTHVCAAYLLLCHTFQNWNSLFLLAKHGKNSAIQTLLRTIKESLMLVQLFAVESFKNKRDNIDKWYSGEIISHGAGRKEMGDLSNDYSPSTDIDIKNLEAHIYQMESQSSHNSYATVLEGISPFTEDYDSDGNTGFYRTVHALKYAGGVMTRTNITINFAYSLLLKDQEGFLKADKILLKYDPNINQSKFQQI